MGIEKLKVEMAGEITISNDPGTTMRKWREIFNISQIELAEYLGISPSTISDYEGNRRRSPGANVIRRFVDALLDMDMKMGGRITEKLLEDGKKMDEFFETHEFVKSISVEEFSKLINGKIIVNQQLSDIKKLYGYTIIDSIKVILEMPPNFFSRIFGNTSERALIFTNVSTGRSPLTVIRVTPTKPSVIVLHGLDERDVDKLAIKIAEKEQIPITITKMNVREIKDVLNKF